MSENIFNIDQNVEEAAPSKYVLIEKEGDYIQDNVYIKSLEIGEDNRFYIITAVKGGQEMQTQRQYFPDRSTAQNDETYKKAISIKQGLLANFLRKFKGEDATVQAASWTELVRKIDEECKSLYATTPLRVKLELVENKGKYYSNISTFAPFERMEVPLSESRHKITARDKQMLRNKLSEDMIVPDSDSETPKDDSPF